LRKIVHVSGSPSSVRSFIQLTALVNVNSGAIGESSPAGLTLAQKLINLKGQGVQGVAMLQVMIAKNRLAELVDYLLQDSPVVGPVAAGCGQYRFAEVQRLEDMSLDAIPTILPPKKYYLPQYETLLEYDITHGQRMQALVEVERRVLFGVRTCDLAGIQCLNVVFADRPRDMHYMIRKGFIFLIGLECNHYCDHHASCALMRTHLPRGGYDLFLSELEQGYFVHINTQWGEDVVETSGLFQPVGPSERQQLQDLRTAKRKIFHSEVSIRYQDIATLFEKTFDSAVWSEIGERCLSCGNCTNVCPTCYCFDMLDEPSLDLNRGRRLRVWDSCQHENFAKVAGGESFRPLRSERKRHRFNRKFHYPMERYQRMFCTGCGRCSRTCMAKIDLKKTLNALLAEEVGA
jgi:sulfhydrogenase subunit beta (sulfur reductase)